MTDGGTAVEIPSVEPLQESTGKQDDDTIIISDDAEAPHNHNINSNTSETSVFNETTNFDIYTDVYTVQINKNRSNAIKFHTQLDRYNHPDHYS